MTSRDLQQLSYLLIKLHRTAESAGAWRTMALCYKKKYSLSVLNFVCSLGWLVFILCRQEVQGQEFILNGKSYSNDETIELTTINEEHFLLCKTSQTGCCGKDASGNVIAIERRGDFYFPNGTKVPIRSEIGSDGFFRARGYQYIGLKRLNLSSTIPPTGRYHCNIPDMNGNNHTDLYINIDYDECTMGNNDCLDIAICSNTLESFVCTCPPGYSGDGKQSGIGCQDINECATRTDDCIDGACVNTEGSFTCSCPSGFNYGDGKTNGTGCQVVAPDVNVSVVSSEVHSSVYEKASDEEYVVKIGHRFQVQCVSTGQFRGEVTWLMMNSEGNFTPVVEVDQTGLEATGNHSGSSNSSSTLPHLNTTHSNILEVHDEVIGQLYAYRLTPSVIILGTRNSIVFGAEIGIGKSANGTYKCFAENGYSRRDVELSIRVPVPNMDENARYFLRFSTIHFGASVMESLNLDSIDFVLAIFETALLKSLTVLSTGRANQEKVYCYNVTRRPIDVINTWDRVECRTDNVFGKTTDDLLSIVQKVFVPSLQDINIEIISQESIAVSQHGFCDYEYFVSSDDRGSYEWNETLVSDPPSVSEQNCYFEPQDLIVGGMARRSCVSHQKWMHPLNVEYAYDGTECATKSTYELRKLSQLVEINPDQVDEIGAAIVNIVSDLNESGEQTSNNLDVIANVYEKVDNLIHSGQLNVSEDFTNNTLSVLDGISTWPQSVLHMRSSTFVKSTEAITTNLANQSDFTSLTVVEEYVALMAERQSLIDLIENGVMFALPLQDSLNYVTHNLSMQYPVNNNSTANETRVNISISVPPEAFKNNNGSDVGLVFTSYPTPILFPLSPPTTNTNVYNYVVDSAVLGFTIPEIEVKDLNNNVNITLQSLRAQAGMIWSKPICVSWQLNATKDGQGNWTDRGCQLVFMDLVTGEIRCECSHLTNFAVLVSVNPPVNSETVENALKVLSIVGAIISLLGLVITVFTMLFFRKIRKRDASKFHTQLCIAMIGLLLSFLIGIDRTENEIACTFFSCLIQYFTLASLFWMGAEAVLMFKKLIIVFGRLRSRFIIAISIICWGVPVTFPVIGLTTLATGNNFLVSIQEDKQQPGYCFISDTKVQYGIFLGPLFVILLFNVVIFILVTAVLIRYTKRKIEKDKELQNNTFRMTVKAMISIGSVMVMFGLTWLFGALTIDKGSIVFQWFFVIFNTLQGFFLFLFFCIIGTDARDELKNFFTCNYFAKEEIKTTVSSTSHIPKRFGVLMSGRSKPNVTSTSSLGHKANGMNGDGKKPSDDRLKNEPTSLTNGLQTSREDSLLFQDVKTEKNANNEISVQSAANSMSIKAEEAETNTEPPSERNDSRDPQFPLQVVLYEVQRSKSNVAYSWETTKTVSLQHVSQNLNSYNHDLSGTYCQDLKWK